MIDERLGDDQHPAAGEGRDRERSRSIGTILRTATGAVRRTPPWGVVLLAAIAYVPSLTAAPGRMPADTKLYLYLNPGRLMADAPFTWDTRQFAGWVPHQTIAYLWPSGPWFAAFEAVGVPDWIAHRLWLGTILFLGGLGVRWAARHLGLSSAGATVAGALYATSPYILPYVSRTSVMLLPWAAVGWLVGLTIRATSRTRWRDAAVFALVVLTVGAVNATALALIAPAPVLWLLHAAWQRTITCRAAVVTAAKIGLLSLLVSIWWIAMLLVQGRHGADVLAFSETLDAVSLTSVSTETLRGMGYWLFYVRDPYAFTTTASYDYMSSLALIAATWLLLIVSLVGLAAVRWSQRRYAALLVGTGVVLAVGVHPIDDPSPLMAPLRDSALGLALRSSTRALPLSTFGLALGAGALVTAVAAAHLPASWAVRPWRVRTHRIGVVALAPAIVLLAVFSLPAMFTGGYVDPALERDADVPSAWTEAAALLDAGSTEHRVLQLPGSEFGAFRWGYTVDPPLPGLTDKPLVTRDLLPLGSPAAMDLLYALDNRFQAGTVDPASLAAVARFLGADTIWLANDLAFERFRTPRPETISAMFAVPPPGLGTPLAIGAPQVNTPDIAMLDEQELSSSGADALIGQPLAPIELVEVEQPVAIVRAATDTVVLAGSGDGIVDAAAAGLLEGDEAVVYAGDLAALDIDDGVSDDSLLVVTDSNRDRAMQWRGSQDVLGLTERGGPDAEATRVDVADQRLAATASPDADDQTVTLLDPALEVSASAYGEPFAYRPEDRPSMAVDGDPSTAWRVADRFDPVGESIQLSTTDGALVLLQDQHPTANRMITQVRIDVDGTASMFVALDERSLVAPGQTVAVAPGRPLTITIEAVADREGVDSGPSAVGFAELGPVALEYTRLPLRPLDRVDGERPLAIVMTRERVRSTNRWRADPDPVMRRQFELGSPRTFDAVVTLRLDQRAGDAVLDALQGTSSPAVADRRLAGVAAARGAAAVDGDRGTAWTTPFGQAVGSSITVPLAPVDSTAPPPEPIRIVQPDDEQHARITEVAITSPSLPSPIVVAVDAPDAGGSSALPLLAAQLQAIDAGGSVTLTITGVDGRTISDRRYAEQVQLPASIVEIDGLRLAPSTAVTAPDCHQGLVHIDDTPVGVVFGADTAARLLAGEAVDVTACTGSLALDAGVHRLTTTPGITTGVDVDRVVLRSNPSASDPVDDVAASANAAASNTVLDVRRTRTVRTATVAPCPTGCWLILGEGYNPAWTAHVLDVPTGDSSATSAQGGLGAPVPISGGFNGWWLAPNDGVRTIEMRWTPQSDLNLALMAAFGAVLVCLLVAIVDRRVLRSSVGFEPPQLELLSPRRSRRTAIVAALALVVMATVVIEPAWGAAAIVPAALMAVVARPRLFVWSAAASAGVLGMWMVRRQHAYRFFADAAWPVQFDDLHGAGLFVVVLVVAGSLADERGARDLNE